MNQNITYKLDGLDLSLQQTMAEMGGKDNRLLNTMPKEGAWSVTQILNHLMLVEHYTLSYCQKKINARDLKKQTVMSKLRLYALQAYIKSPLKFKAPKGVDSSSLPESDTIDNIHKEWQKKRVELRAFLNGLTEEQLKLAVYKHPAAGRFTFNDMLSFLQAHYNIHKKQINRTLKTID